MHQTQLAITEIKRFIKRRKAILILAPLLLVSLSVTAAYMLPPKYESSITILVEKDETLNPMIQYTMAVAMASEDRLRSFNEIIYSRSTVNMLIDSLDLADENMASQERDDLIKEVRSNITTNLRASDSFSISFLNGDPELAQKGVTLLADHFIQTRLSLENRRNEQTVDFFENKLESLQASVEEREQRMMAQMQNDDQVVREDDSIQSDLDRVDSELSNIERSVTRTERSLNLLRDVNQGELEIKAIRELNLSGLPSGDEMRENLNQHRDYLQRYTPQYPQVRELSSKIHDLAEQMIVEIEADLFELQQERMYLQDQRTELRNQLEQTVVATQERSDARSDYEVYNTMLEEMKVKVEQARGTRELGDMAENQFVVIDSAIVPQNPAKPNKILLIAGGIMIGLFLGVVGAGVAELLDTTIRRPEDVKHFEIPVIAYIPSGKT